MQGKKLPERSAGDRVYIGIDACKAWLDVYIHPAGRPLRVANTREGLRRLRHVLAEYDVALAIVEATAKYHRLAQRMLHGWGVAVAVVNPLRPRLFAEAAGILAKTDPLDARVLALFGESLGPQATPPLPEHVEELQELVRARQAANADLVAFTNRRGAGETAFLRRELGRLVKSVQAHIARLDVEIERRIGDDDAFARRYEILRSIPSVGPVGAATLAVCLLELGQLSGKAVTMLTGLAPIACDSGDKSAQRHIRGGRAHLRPPLYMAALSAIRVNPDMAAFYKRLRNAGKAAKVAIVAVMRKLLILANTLITEDRLWKPIRA